VCVCTCVSASVSVCLSVCLSLFVCVCVVTGIPEQHNNREQRIDTLLCVCVVKECVLLRVCVVCE